MNSNPLQQIVYVHHAVQKSLVNKKPSSYIPVPDGFITTSGQSATKIDAPK